MITGASRGIGRAIAVHMAELGAQVVINYNGSEEKAKEVQKEIIEAGGRAHIYKCNVADFKECENFVKEITAKFGRIDILVNNAGITKDGLLMSMSEEAFDQVLRVNLKGAFHMIRFVSRQMLKQRSGRIINISSVWGSVGASCEVAYSATKGAIHSLTKGLAKELAPSNIAVNALACGMIDTKMNDCFSKHEIAHICDEIPAGRMGTPAEVAEAIALLAEAPIYLTGQIITMDGGWC